MVGISDIAVRVFRHDKWNIGLVSEPISFFLRTSSQPKIRWLSYAENDKYLADPFAVVRGGRVYILCEEFDYRLSKGRIVALELTENLSSFRLEVAMERPFHMSYPYSFEYRGNIYCIPETYQAREIALYRAERFPTRWKKVATLVDNFAGIDSTVFEYEGHWWLMCAGEAKPHYRLFIWRASNPLGPWVPHEGNPVKMDISSSRPAGTPFLHDGYLYRPAQDCSRTYGGSIVLNRVLTLTAYKFKEERASVIQPYITSPYRDGIHTLSAAGNITIIDAKRRVFNRQAFRTELMTSLGLRGSPNR